MRAAYYERIGPAREVLTIGDVATPEPGAGEVRVKLAASGVNPSDVKMRLGRGSARSDYPLIIPHSDGAGVIDKVGAGVPPQRVGERVWTWNARWGRAFGTAAEFVVLPAQQAVAMPKNTEFAAGACLGIPALTAWQACVTDGGVKGQTVLVAGGAGAVGHYAIQLAKIKGARLVVATVSSEAKAAHAKAAGADHVIDYKTEDVAERVKQITSGQGVQRLIEVDIAGNAKHYPAIMADHGLVAVYGSNDPNVQLAFGPMIVGNMGLRFFIVYKQPPALRAQALGEITAYLEGGKLQHAVGKRFPLAEIAAAHEAVEQGSVIGNVVVDIA
jgi:NADPH2:quinone reductase